MTNLKIPDYVDRLSYSSRLAGNVKRFDENRNRITQPKRVAQPQPTDLIYLLGIWTLFGNWSLVIGI